MKLRLSLPCIPVLLVGISHGATMAPISGPGANVSGSKDAIAPEIGHDTPGAFCFTVEAGYASKYISRGIDIPQFTSFNNLSTDISKADSDVLFVGGDVTCKGFQLGVKYTQPSDDNFNPFFARSLTELDNYSELVISANYTRMLAGPDWLQGTVGVDFYYYPNDLFWGVSNQGMAYARFSSPHYKWAQPFVELFYNFAIDSAGAGLADGTPDQIKYPGATSFRGATGSQLVEGCGFELGVNGQLALLRKLKWISAAGWPGIPRVAYCLSVSLL